MKCYHCGTEISITRIVGISEECPKCRSDVRVCFNCNFYDKSAYNDCRESNAERVVEKNRRTHCDYFRAANSDTESSSDNRATKSKEDILRDLDNLFKK